jgi:DNA-binding LacI/PurR family transcriptional regulator
MKANTTEILPLSGLKSEMARNRIATLIRSGQLSPGQKLPSESDLSKKLNVNVHTVRRGLAELVADGLIEKRPRVGNFVKSSKAAGRIGIVLHRNFADHGKNQHPAGLLLEGAAVPFTDNGYLSCTFAYRHGQLWRDVGEVAVANGIQGILLQAGFDISFEDLKKFNDAGIKLVLFGYHTAALELGIPMVSLQTGMALSQIITRLVDLGHHRIVYVREANSPVRDLENVLLSQLCARYNLGNLSDFCFDIPNEDNITDFSGLSKLFENTNQPTAIVASDDITANEVFRLCYARKIRVPDDISLAARWDAMPTMHPVPLTAPDCLTLGRHAVEICAKMLMKLLSGEEISECSVTLRCDAQWKESIGAAPNM